MCIGGHDRRTPSLHFYPETNTWYCFGCGIHGDALDLVQRTKVCNFREALIWLRGEFAERIQKQQPGMLAGRRRSAKWVTSSATEQAARKHKPDPEVYSWFMSRCKLSPDGLDYLLERGYTHETVKHFQLGEIRNPDSAIRIAIEKWGTHRLVGAGLVTLSRSASHSAQGKLIWSQRSIMIPFFTEVFGVRSWKARSKSEVCSW